ERTVWATPAPTYGPALLGALREADRGGDLAAAARSAVRRLRGTATPAAPGGATAQPAAGRAPARATATGSAGSVEGTSVIEGTSVVGATDDEGAIVVIVHSNSFPQFGSGLIVDEYDLVLSNRAGRGFGRPGAPDGPAPGRRPPTTLHAWALGAGGDGDGRPTLFGATPGGEQQVAWNAQVITGLLDRIDADDAHESGAGRGLPTAAVLGHALDRVLTTRRWSTTATGTVWADETATAVRPAHVVVGRAGGDALVGAADPGIGATAVGV
ncbi:gamma-glutamyltransferase, partial [Pseudofrankia sp. BMG5.36]